MARFTSSSLYIQCPSLPDRSGLDVGWAPRNSPQLADLSPPFLLLFFMTPPYCDQQRQSRLFRSLVHLEKQTRIYIAINFIKIRVMGPYVLHTKVTFLLKSPVDHMQEFVSVGQD